MAQLPVIAVEDILTIAGEVRHSGCTKAVLCENDAAQTGVFRLSRGGLIQSHLHSRVFDIFLGISGCVDITYEGQQGDGVIRLHPHSFCSMPPGVRHEVRNTSTREDAVFLVIHAPNAGYDFIPVTFRRTSAAANPADRMPGAAATGANAGKGKV